MSPEHASNYVRTVLPRELQDECKEQVVNDLADCCVLMSKPVLLLCRIQFKTVQAGRAGVDDLQDVWFSTGVRLEKIDWEESNFARWEMGIKAAPEAENLSHVLEMDFFERTLRKAEVLERRSAERQQKFLAQEQDAGGSAACHSNQF